MNSLQDMPGAISLFDKYFKICPYALKKKKTKPHKRAEMLYRSQMEEHCSQWYLLHHGDDRLEICCILHVLFLHTDTFFPPIPFNW